MDTLPVPGSPEDIYSLLARYRERIELILCNLQRHVADPGDYMLLLRIEDWCSDGARKVKISPVALQDAPDVQHIGAFAEVVAERAPRGLAHIIIVSPDWTHHALFRMPCNGDVGD